MTKERFTLAQAEAYIAENQATVDKTFKPDFHFTAPVGWINDPNGFVYFRGAYHLFYQYYPYDSQWGPMHWGHATTTDFIHWEHLPVALAPDQDYDKDGCFSGSAIVKDDRLWLMYTGHLIQADGSIRQVQNIAFSDDGLHFTKLATNPVMKGESVPEIDPADFRDPKLFEKDGRYYAVVAAKHVDQVGCIVLLGSDDLENWRFESIFLKGIPEQGIMWECPDYFQLNGQDCLIMSPMRYPRAGENFHNINANIVMYGQVDWEKKAFQLLRVEEIDHGHDFYAAQTAEGPEGQRIMLAWMQTWGRQIPPHQLRHGWAGAMTLARKLTIQSGQLRQTPYLPPVIGDWEIISEAWQKSQVNPLRLDVTMSKPATWELRVGSETDCLRLIVDKDQVRLERAGLQRDLGGEEIPLLPMRQRTVSTDVHHLTIVLDKSSIEVFVNDGEASLTSTFYVEQLDLDLQVQAGKVRLCASEFI